MFPLPYERSHSLKVMTVSVVMDVKSDEDNYKVNVAANCKNAHYEVEDRNEREQDDYEACLWVIKAHADPSDDADR
jgi:hypothetical protein